ncbi:hypothetical protein GH714_000372 [Hevea brasiliensis]|uniref:Cytochrome P450 n=1 Tax=Hevea brasiliensis TaxID=3981 RepID=A0A6A6KSR9_HEVBR|nr:hypothetical protein GH714_000372 [Hevea brasiliensis]
MLGDLADKYGPIFTLQIGVHKALVVSSWEVAKELFTSNDIATANRPNFTAAKYLSYDGVMFSFAPYGDIGENAQVDTLELLSSRQLELLKHVRIDCREEVLRCYCWDDRKEAERCHKAMRELFHFMGLFVLRDAIPFLGWLDVGGHERGMRKLLKNWTIFSANGWRSIAGREILVMWLTKSNFMSVMLSVLERTHVGGFDSDTINKSTCLKPLKKVQEELDTMVGRDRLVNESDISKMIYLQAIVKESLRLYPPAPLSGPREITENCTISGYHVKKGTWLLTNLWKIHIDPRIWPDPLEFKPERFLTSHKNIDVRGQNFELIPFGSGRRGCPGTSFGLQMVAIGLASFLQAFEISNPTSSPIDMTGSFGITNIKATPLQVLLLPRLSPEFYNLY